MTQKCTECGSTSVRKSGIRYGREKKQRWQCKNCGCVYLKPLNVRSLPDIKRKKAI